MKVWLVTVIVLFGIVELFQWASHAYWIEQIALLPTPILLAAGVGLAIASNAKKRLPWQDWPHSPGVPDQSSPSQAAVRSTGNSVKLEQ